MARSIPILMPPWPSHLFPHLELIFEDMEKTGRHVDYGGFADGRLGEFRYAKDVEDRMPSR